MHPALRHKENGVILGRIRALLKSDEYEKVLLSPEGDVTLDPEYLDTVEVAAPVPVPKIDLTAEKAPNISKPTAKAPKAKAPKAKAPKKAAKPKATTEPKPAAEIDPLDDISSLLDDLGGLDENSE